MSNTYAIIKTEDIHTPLESIKDLGYKNTMELSLTAFMGGEKHTQLTVQISSTLPAQGGIGYITLGDAEVDLLIAALLERKLRKITATGDEQSIFCPAGEED